MTVSIAFRLTDGFGLTRQKDLDTSNTSRSQLPFGLLTDLDEVIENLNDLQIDEAVSIAFRLTDGFGRPLPSTHFESFDRCLNCLSAY